MQAIPRSALITIWLALGACWAVGILDRGYWTPDEPREADLAWRMSWQPSKAVPLLAGEPFCEKPPLAYWVSGAAIAVGGADAWVARLPNLLYALLTALAVGALGRRAAGPVAGVAAAAAMSTFLLSYQVAIWLATDAPLLAAVSLALLGLHVGFHAAGTAERVRGYSVMHLALAAGFLAKSAAAWMVPVLTLATLIVWERRWRELTRWELYVGLLLQAALIVPWVWVVYQGPDGPSRLEVFFWNNLAGRFAHVDAPQELQYAAAHRNSPGKYLIELPVYLWPWTLLAAAAARRAWRRRSVLGEDLSPVRFAVAAFVPTLGVLSVAATARNIYLAPALPGVALLLGWWVRHLGTSDEPWDRRALRATSLLLVLSAVVLAVAAVIVGYDSWEELRMPSLLGGSAAGVSAAGQSALGQSALGQSAVGLSALGLAALGVTGAAFLAVHAWRAAGRGRLQQAGFVLLLAYSLLLVGPAPQLYRQVDAWQDLGAVGRAMRRDAAGLPLVLFAPDETTRAFIDMYTRQTVGLIPGPITAQSAERLRVLLAAQPQSLIVTQLAGRDVSRTVHKLAEWSGLAARVARSAPPADELPAWATPLRLRIAHRYALPNGRRYALLAASASP